MTIQEIAEFLKDHSLAKVSKEAGVYYPTVRNVVNGTNTNPSYETFKRLEAYCLAKKSN